MHLLSSILLPLLAPLVLASGNAANPTKYAVQTPPLDTPWTSKVGTNPWPEYPRPQMQRSTWLNLNGIWTYQNASGLEVVESPPFGQLLANEVLVPSCLESGLSGIQGKYMLYSWFSTNFTIPSAWNGQNILLNFGAVDYEATVFVNGQKAAFNRGGYHKFTVDVTEYVEIGQHNELLVFVHDPTDMDNYVIPVGKQTLEQSHIFYRPCSGIWQSVWVEPAPALHVTGLDVAADMNGQVNATVHSSSQNPVPVQIDIYDSGTQKILASHNGSSDLPFQFNVSSPKLWSPLAPTLYNFTVKLGLDQVESYTGFRTISKGTANGIVRPMLNGESVFMFGILDQGYWPDGLYTPPNRAAMVYDVQMLKNLGFNTLRKHIKVENDLFYQACDEMGILVIQDMPALPSSKLPNADQQVEFNRQLEILINQHKSYPSIVTWVIYNEGWGQVTTGPYPEYGLTDLVRSLDPTRLIDSVTGWYDHGAGDYSDNHHYSSPQCGTPFYSINSPPYDPTRIGFQGEFGGIGNNVSIDHLWNVQEAIDQINKTYELYDTVDVWNSRSHSILTELKDQTETFACSGAVWTQTTDVEGEVNGLLTYDRRILRPDEIQWKADIQALYDADRKRASSSMLAVNLSELVG